MFVIGTAGHVDHGKSALIQALTGTHPDRLREEQERGMTIELGFAWMTLPSGREVSIVDVPGHVRFVRHMLAGISAVDLALLVIAADEGVMPQTREHLEILDLLEVRNAVVVLTKCDLVDEDWADLVEEETRAFLAGTSLADAPFVRVSSVTGAGLDDLRAAIDTALDATTEPRDIGRPRLGIDRVFTMTGFGTVVTGTLLDGRLRVGDTMEVAPGGPTARIRGLQTHRHEVQEALPGTRTAVNLAGVAVEEIARGQVLAPPGRIVPVRAFDALLHVLPDRPIRHNLRVAVHAGSAEVQGRVRVLGSRTVAVDAGEASDEIPGDADGWAQVILAEPIAAVPGDLFVLRLSDETVGGGRIVEVNPPRHRRHSAATVERLEARAAGTPESRVLAALERSEPTTASALRAAVEASADDFAAAMELLQTDGAVRAFPAPTGEPVLLTAGGHARLADEVARALAAFHAARPLRWSMPREELRGVLKLPQREFTAVLGGLAPEIEARGDGFMEASWTPALTPAQQAEVDRIERALRDGGTQAPRQNIDPELMAYLEGAGRVVDCGDGTVLSREAYAEVRARIIALLQDGRELTLAEARDALDTNRRSAQAILEALDRDAVTRRHGDARVLHESLRPPAG
ncbi:MAG: selenocysteine-specific translation elongation factor [Dehalococcoidia bacterium]